MLRLHCRKLNKKKKKQVLQCHCVFKKCVYSKKNVFPSACIAFLFINTPTFSPQPNIIIKNFAILKKRSTFNAIKLLNKHSEMHTQCNRSLSDESVLTLAPLQGSCCGQANSRNADWYPKGSGLRISLSASLFFLSPKQSRALWC